MGPPKILHLHDSEKDIILNWQLAKLCEPCGGGASSVRARHCPLWLDLALMYSGSLAAVSWGCPGIEREKIREPYPQVLCPELGRKFGHIPWISTNIISAQISIWRMLVPSQQTKRRALSVGEAGSWKGLRRLLRSWWLVSHEKLFKSLPTSCMPCFLSGSNTCSSHFFPVPSPAWVS